ARPGAGRRNSCGRRRAGRGPDPARPTARGAIIPAAESDGPMHPQARPSVVVAVLCTTGVLASLVQTIIIPLVPRLPELLGAGPADASWAVTATLLVGAIMTPIAGRLGDMYGKRRVLALCLASLIAGSALCALTSSLIPVTVGRGLQGVSMGVIALGISI